MALPSPDEASTRERLLLKAAELFALRGFESVSLRDLTRAAGVNLAAVNYHFGSKEALVEEVVARLMKPVNDERLAQLDAAVAAAHPQPADASAVADAFLRPVMRLVRESPLSEQLFFKLMGRCLLGRTQIIPAAAMPHFEGMVRRFADALRRANPGLSHAEACWRLNFMAGSLISTLAHADIATYFAGEKAHPPDTETLLRRLVQHCTGSLEAPATDPTSPRRKTAARGLAAFALALLLSACGSLSPESRVDELDLDVPGTWAARPEARAGVDEHWLQHFRDPRLEALVEEALANNRDLRAAAARVERTRGQTRLAGVAGNPTADLQFDPLRTKRNFVGIPIGPPGTVPSNVFNTFDLSLVISWEADVWGRIRAGKSAAYARSEAAEADAQAARAALAANVARAWFALAEARTQQNLARETLAAHEQTAKAVRERFQAGDDLQGAAAQLRLAETDVANSRAAVAERDQQLEAAQRRLELLLGRYPSGRIAGEARLPAPGATPPTGLPSELLLRRPDVLAAERRFAASGKSLSEARRAVFPRLSLTGSAGTATGELNDLLNSDFGVWQIAANVIQPVFAGGRIRAETAIRSADEKEALADLQQTVLTAFSEVETALANERHLAARAQSLAEAVRLATEADQAARADYARGLGDLLTVLAAQTRLLQARAQQLSVQRLRLENRIDLHLALGGDFQPQPPAAPAT
jgi:NodT family efflux transporter outer membrane factor (OMF) lipoprotein